MESAKRKKSAEAGNSNGWKKAGKKFPRLGSLHGLQKKTGGRASSLPLHNRE